MIRSGKSYHRGFTLLEIMVAVSIFALIAAMTTTNLVQVGKAGERVSEAQRRLAEVQFALAYLGKDITQIIDRKIRDQFGDEQPGLKLTEDSLAFSRTGWSNLLQQPRSDLQRVEYLLNDSQLVRRYRFHLDQPYTDGPIEQPLLERVSDFSVKLLTQGKQEYEIWPPDTETGDSEEPIAIQITLDIDDIGLIYRVFELNNAVLQQ